MYWCRDHIDDTFDSNLSKSLFFYLLCVYRHRGIHGWDTQETTIPEIKHNYPSLSNGRENIFSYSIFNNVTTPFNLIVSSIPFINNRQHLIMPFRQSNQDGGDKKKETANIHQASGWHSPFKSVEITVHSLSFYYHWDILAYLHTMDTSLYIRVCI